MKRYSDKLNLLHLCDMLAIGGLCLLLVATPLAFGSVHPWAFSLMEALIFLLVVVWMIKVIFLSRRDDASVGHGKAILPCVYKLSLPLWSFVALSALQLLPLSPGTLSRLSPATYTVYSKSLPGWPEQRPYHLWVTQDAADQQNSENEGGIEERGESDATVLPQSLTQAPVPTGEWLPLSLTPGQTYLAGLKFVAYVALFCFVLSYPVGRQHNNDTNRRFLRKLITVIVGNGLLIALIGIAQRFFWNGKILWFFVPKGWGSPMLVEIPRASGPFVNGDHFANYLALILPLTLGGMLSQGVFRDRRQARRWLALCSVTFGIVSIGILLSLSRGAWLAIGIGGLPFLWCGRVLFALRRSQVLLCRLLLLGSVVLLLCFVLGGTSLDDQVSSRIKYTLTEDAGLHERVAVWQASLAMIRDFPLFGVGLGAWADVFPHYQKPPWNVRIWQQAHNDYIQCLTEAGLIGAVLLGWFFLLAAMQLHRGLRSSPPELLPIGVGMISSLIVMAVHSGVDFSLQIPANAVLFIVLLAIVLRLSHHPAQARQHSGQARIWSRSLVAVGAGTVAMACCVLALTQKELRLVTDPEVLTSVAEARSELLASPSRAVGHRALFELLEEDMALAERIRELEIALWLEPLQPEVRDQYAFALREQGDRQAALDEIRTSVFFSPVLATHTYLETDEIASLDAAELAAVDEGLQRAVVAGHEGAVEGLAEWYGELQRPLEQAAVYAQAAGQEPIRLRRAYYLREAGLGYVRANAKDKAEPLLRQAITLVPQHPTAYRVLIVEILAARGDFTEARMLIAQGIAHGVKPTLLWLALVDGALKAGDQKQAKVILQEVTQQYPYSFDAAYRLGALNFREKAFDQAVLWLRKATELRPDSVEALSLLGLTEEQLSAFEKAQDAYSQALAVKPGDKTLQKHEAALAEKTTALSQ
ncbi:MAG: O-antigen ligase family protein [Candidatus Binatia bacterium]